MVAGLAPGFAARGRRTARFAACGWAQHAAPLQWVVARRARQAPPLQAAVRFVLVDGHGAAFGLGAAHQQYEGEHQHE